MLKPVREWNAGAGDLLQTSFNGFVVAPDQGLVVTDSGFDLAAEPSSVVVPVKTVGPADGWTSLVNPASAACQVEERADDGAYSFCVISDGSETLGDVFLGWGRELGDSFFKSLPFHNG